MRVLCVLLLLATSVSPSWGDPIRPKDISPYADRRASQVGDSVTLVIRDVTSVVQRLDDRSDRGTRVSMPTVGALLSGFLMLPSLSSGTTSGAQVQENLAHRFETTMTCRVVEVLANDALRIEGRRSVTLNNEPQSLTVRGVLRTEDLGPDNSCESSRLAELEIDYRGPLTGRARAGLIRSVLEILF